MTPIRSINRRMRDTSNDRAWPRGARDSPRDGALGVKAFEVPKQQHAEIPTRWQARPTDFVSVEPLTKRLDVSVEVRDAEDLIQSRVDGVRGGPRQILRDHPHRRLLQRRPRLSIAMRDSVVRGIDRVDPFLVWRDCSPPRKVAPAMRCCEYCKHR